MRGFARIASAAFCTAVVAFAGATAWGQANNNNNNNNGGQNNGQNNQNNNGVTNISPAGVMVSPDGVLKVKQFTDRTGELTRTRMAESRARLSGEVAKGSKLRKISLPRLEA